MTFSSRIQELKLQIVEHERQLQDLRRELELADFEAKSDITKTSPAFDASDPTPTAATRWRWPLAADAYRRYGRQMIMPEIGLQGQLSLGFASVLIVGIGGLGCPAASYLAGAGVGRLGLMDGDTVELSNLHRQILHTTQRVGKLKVKSARDNLQALNPLVKYILHPEHLTPTTAVDIFASYDLILDCTDHPTSRYLISDAAVLAGKPLISASALRTDGQLLVLNHPPSPPLAQREVAGSEGGPCYRCVFPVPPPAESVLSCGEGGVLGPVVGVMGVLMALEAMKLLTFKSSEPATEQRREQSMLIFSATSSPPFRSVRLRGKRKACAACSDKATISAEALSLGNLDYAMFCGTQNSIQVLGEAERMSAKEFKHQQQVVQEVSSPVGLGMRSYVLLDVRDKTQYGLCYLDGSINIPWTSMQGMESLAQATIPDGQQCMDEGLPTNGEDLLSVLRKAADGGKDIYTICRFGNDSQLAVQKLKELGFSADGRSRVRDIKGGFRAWKQEVDTDWPEY